jgi:hypothetical protein
MSVVLVIAAFLSALYALVNTFATWMVVRRKPSVAMLFMLAAALLMVAAAALVTAIPYTRVLLASGLALASLASFLNAQLVVGKVVWRNHLLRAALALALYAFAHWALGRMG